MLDECVDSSNKEQAICIWYVDAMRSLLVYIYQGKSFLLILQEEPHGLFTHCYGQLLKCCSCKCTFELYNSTRPHWHCIYI